MLGFPIRTSADQCPVDGSPQLFAVTHVLHRFLAPRHPPLALCSLEEQRCSCSLCNSQGAPVSSAVGGLGDGPAMRSPTVHRAELEASGRGVDRREERGHVHSLKTEQRATAPVRRRRRARELHPTSAFRCRVASAPTGNPSQRSDLMVERS